MGSSWFRGIALRPDGHGHIVGARGLMLTVDGRRFMPSKDRL
jgi:proteasome assembly chaperone (PAC2) family protein